MNYKIRTRPEEWACTKFCRIDLSEDSVKEFLLWLCDSTHEQLTARLDAESKGEPVWYDPVESLWGFDAPRQRVAKLLWQLLHNNASDEEFDHRFCFPSFDCPNSVEVLQPIQQRLKSVMDGLFSRQEEDRELGQTDWGERWWLPAEQATFVRDQLKMTHVGLIERASDYDDAVAFSLNVAIRNQVQAIEVPSNDAGRVYIGTHRGPHNRTFVWVQDEGGRKYPLKHGIRAYLEAEGTGYSWGYGGHGPGELAHCILADALDGDLVMASELEDAFFEEFTLTYPQDEDFRLAHTTVMNWLQKIGAKAKWECRRPEVAARRSEYAPLVAARRDLLVRLRNLDDLRSQRFDIVPTTFEAALYLDLMRMLESSDYALKCSSCGLPIPSDNSGRSNRQRARAQKGQPIYHPECFEEHGRTRKLIDWRRRSRSKAFRDKEKKRAREYRQLPTTT
jgi:hypothetical protein